MTYLIGFAIYVIVAIGFANYIIGETIEICDSDRYAVPTICFFASIWPLSLVYGFILYCIDMAYEADE